MILPYKGYVIVQQITNKVGGFEIVGASQTLLSGKVLRVSLEKNEFVTIKAGDILVFDMTESMEYTFNELGKVVIVPEKAIVAVDNGKPENYDPLLDGMNKESEVKYAC